MKSVSFDDRYPVLFGLVGLAVVAVAIAGLMFVEPTVGMVALAAVALLLWIAYVYGSTESQAMFLQRCLGRNKEFWFKVLLISMLIFFLYPVVALPLFLIASIRLLMGRC